MRKLILATAAACALAFAGVASAGGPTRTTDTFSGSEFVPANTFVCDFNYSLTVSGVSAITDFGDRVEVHTDVTVVHTNVDTGTTLTEEDHLNQTLYPDGTEKDIRLFWHLRDANGKLVVVHSGQVTYNDSGDIVNYTPNSAPDFNSVICPALGGNPV